MAQDGAGARVVANPPIRRMWLIFFSDNVPTFWSRMLRPGFRHVAACSYFDDQRRWIYVDPCRRGTVIEVLRGDEFGPRFQQLLDDSHAILRIGALYGRTRTPASFHCVGAIKALIGLRSGALWPSGLYRDLVAAGAEKVEPPHVRTIREQQHDGAAGGPRDAATA